MRIIACAAIAVATLLGSHARGEPLAIHGHSAVYLTETDEVRFRVIVSKKLTFPGDIFIDNDTNLIKRIITSSDEKQMAKQRELGGGGRSGTIEGRHYVYDLEWTKEEVPDKVFEDPDFLLPQRKKPK